MSTQSQRALLLSGIVSQLERRVNEFLDYSEAHPQALFNELEAKARDLSRDLFAQALQLSVQARRQGAESGVQCQCGNAPLYKGEHSRHQQTYVGQIELERAYYYCPACRKGHYPLDELLGIGSGQFSDGLQKGICLLGVGQAFEPAARAFEALTGVGVSTREAERLTEARGGALEEHLEQERHRLLDGMSQPATMTGRQSHASSCGGTISAPLQPVPAAQDGRGKDQTGVWAVALDAARVRFEDGWHEVKAGAVFRAVAEEVTARQPASLESPQETVKAGLRGEGDLDPPQEDPRLPEAESPEATGDRCPTPASAGPEQGEQSGCTVQARAQSYIARVGGMEEAGERLYAEAVRRGIDVEEELLVCLGDGATGNWSQFELHFPNRAEVLDWWHAVEHLWAAGNGVFGEGLAQAKQWVQQRKHELWEGKVEEVIAALQAQVGGPQGQAAQEEIHYFETNKERMRYNEFRAKGYPIGSGVVESTCKRLIGARLKQAGMCWTKAGAQAVLNLRAALLSGHWDQSWRATSPLPKAA